MRNFLTGSSSRHSEISISHIFSVISSSCLDHTSAPNLGNLVIKISDVRAPPSRDVVLKEFVNLFERLPDCLGVGEEDMECHGNTEGTKDQVRLPLDIGKSRWHEEGESQIETGKASSQHQDLRTSLGHFVETYIQLPAAARPTPLALYLRGKISEA
jgi:hypothetical protein